jgi:hypothetical protein
VVFDKPGQPGIGHLDHGNAGQTQFLDQPVLERAERALDTPLCLRLLAQRMSMFSWVRARPNCVAPSPPARLAMRLEIAARRAEIIECRFRGDKS